MVLEKNTFENGESYEFMNYPEYDSETSLKIFNDFLLNNIKIKFLERKITYDDGSEYILPVTENIYILSDCKSFLIIYDKTTSKLSEKKENPWFFLTPNNAAIYNSDGSLKHQLIIPEDLIKLNNYGQDGWYIHSTYTADFLRLKGFGVMVTNDHHWPELFFCLYDGSPNLKWTGYSQERR